MQSGGEEGGENASWSPEESGLIAREDFGEVLRFNSEKINSEDCDRSVPAVVRGKSTGMGHTSGLPIRPVARPRRSESASRGISVINAV